jgi:cytochrome b6-f complex iron-sulfur subunit
MADTTVEGQKAAGAAGRATDGKDAAPQDAKLAKRSSLVEMLLKPEKSGPEMVVTRRRIVGASIIGFLSVNFLMFLRFFFPRTLFEPSTIFRIGYPADFGFGVDTKFQQQYRVWVVRNAEGLFVIYARCTHLGCTPDWKPAENKFKCPCHGSGFDSEGINFEGPAPRPLDRAHVELDPAGQIVVNTALLYDRARHGEPGAILRV